MPVLTAKIHNHHCYSRTPFFNKISQPTHPKRSFTQPSIHHYQPTIRPMYFVENRDMRFRHITHALEINHQPRIDSINLNITCKQAAAQLEKILEQQSSQPLSYHADTEKSSWHFEIKAENAIFFLNALKQTKNQMQDNFIIGKLQFNKLIDDLAKHHYLSTEQRHQYLKEIQADLTIIENESVTYQNRDFNSAISLIHLYNDSDKKYHNPMSSLYWAIRAFEYLPDSKKMNEHSEVIKFLNDFPDLENALQKLTAKDITLKMHAEQLKNTLQENTAISFHK